MNNKIFLSHSKRDPNTDFFHKVCSAPGMGLITMEFENITPPPSITIRKKVNGSDALFVLLSNYLLDLEYTGSWIAFEVGMACNQSIGPVLRRGKGIDIYVFEPLAEFINFPIPYSNYYMPLQFLNEEVIWLRNALHQRPGIEIGQRFKCPYNDCQLDFQLLKKGLDSINCPACRRTMVIR